MSFYAGGDIDLGTWKLEDAAIDVDFFPPHDESRVRAWVTELEKLGVVMQDRGHDRSYDIWRFHGVMISWREQIPELLDLMYSRHNENGNFLNRGRWTSPWGNEPPRGFWTAEPLGDPIRHG